MILSTFLRSRTMKPAALAATALFGLTGLANAAPRDPSGVYLTDNGKARIRVEHCGPQNASICGYVVWLRAPVDDQGRPKVDYQNPDPKKQSRPSLGLQLMLGLKPDGAGKYEGRLYNAESGKYYDVSVWSEQAGQLTVRGCMMSILCGSETWAQKTDVAPGQLTGPTNGASGPRADAEWAPRGGSPATTGATGTRQPGKGAGQKSAAPKAGEPAAEE